MSLDLTGLERLGSVGLAKVLSELPKGQAKVGIQLAFKIKKAAWVKGDKYGYMYHLDVVIRTLDMQTVLSSELWKVYPSMLPGDVIEAIDTDTYDDTWFLVRTVVNESSKADPKRTKLHLIDTQEGLNAHSGPPKPTVGLNSQAATLGSDTGGSERGQPGVDRVVDTVGGEADIVGSTSTVSKASPSTPCPHENVKMCADALDDVPDGFYCKDCGERVG